MITWTGLGIVGFLLMIAGTAVGAVIPGANLSTIGIGLIVGSVLTYFLGIYLNRTRPERKLVELMTARTAQLHSAAASGTFHRGPGFPMPTSTADAHEQATAMLRDEEVVNRNELRDQHTLGNILMQNVGIGGGVLGLIGFIAGFFVTL